MEEVIRISLGGALRSPTAHVYNELFVHVSLRVIMVAINGMQQQTI